MSIEHEHRDDDQGGEVLDAELIPDEAGEVELHREQPVELPAPTALPAPWAVATPQRRPVVAGWLRDAAQRKQAERWAAGYLGHVVAFHALRVPLYVLRVLGLVPRGLGRIVFALARWATDAEGMPLRAQAVRDGDSKLYLSLCRERDGRVKGRRIALLAGVVVLVVAAVVLRYAPWWAQTLAVLPCWVPRPGLGVARSGG